MTSTSTSLEPLLRIRGLGVAIGGRQILDDISFDITRGEVLGVVGASGSGKSMTASVVMGLAPESATITGSVQFDGNELATLDDVGMCRYRGQRIALVPQDPMGSLTPTRTVGSLLVEAISIHQSVTRAEARSRAVHLLDQVGIPDPAARFDAYPHQLSGGMRQRVGIAIAVANDPELLVADEPTSALDAEVGTKILELFEELLRTRQMSMLLISHDPAVVERMSDRVVTVSHGRVVDEHIVGKRIATEHDSDDRSATPEDVVLAEPSPTDPVLAIRDLTVTYGRTGLRRRGPATVACRDVSLSVGAGEAVALVGPSGSGKTTVLNQVLGLLAPTHGHIEVFGQDTARMSAADRRRVRTRMQAVYQDPSDSLDPRMTVQSIIAEPLRIHRRPAPQNRIVELLDLVGMPHDVLQRHPRQLSGGQQQRVAIARALALGPDLLILDEPVSSLDAPLRTSIMSLLDELRQQLDLAYLIVSHDLGLVRRHVDRLITIDPVPRPQKEYVSS